MTKKLLFATHSYRYLEAAFLATGDFDGGKLEQRPFPDGEIYRRLIGRIERPLLARVLRHTGGNQIKAAAMLGINRNTLRKKIGDLGIEMTAKT